MINGYCNYGAREVALYLVGEVSAQALKYFRNSIVRINDKDQLMRIIAATGLYKAAVKGFDKAAMDRDRFADKPRRGTCELLDTGGCRFGSERRPSKKC